MIDFVASQVWLAPGATDMRKSIDALAITARHVIGQDPTKPHLFVFCGRRRDRIKILYWDRDGFWLLYKRLERGRFRWPVHASAGAICIDRRQLAWLLEGLAIDQRHARSPVPVQLVA